MNIAIYYTPLASVCTPTGVGKHIVHMTGADLRTDSTEQEVAA